MEEFIINYWVQFILGLVAAHIAASLKKYRLENKALRDGMRAILKDRIIQAYNHYMEKQYCPIYGVENVTNMYNAYHNLGGNGTITDLYNKIKQLPTIDPNGNNDEE